MTRKTNTNTKQATESESQTAQCYCCERTMPKDQFGKIHIDIDPRFGSVATDFAKHICKECQYEVQQDANAVANVVMDNELLLQDISQGVHSEIGTYSIKDQANGFRTHEFTPLDINEIGKLIKSQYKQPNFKLDSRRKRNILRILYICLTVNAKSELKELTKMLNDTLDSIPADQTDKRKYVTKVASLMAQHVDFMIQSPTTTINNEDLR